MRLAGTCGTLLALTLLRRLTPGAASSPSRRLTSSSGVAAVPAPNPSPPAVLPSPKAALLRSWPGAATRLLSDFVGGVMDGLQLSDDPAPPPPPRLGDVWSTVGTSRTPDTSSAAENADARTAFAAGDIKSIDDASLASSKRIRVCFRNRTPEPLTLCWMSHRGEPFHFYRLDPVSSNSASGSVGQHIETTSLGHAFLVAKRTPNHEKKKKNKKKKIKRTTTMKNSEGGQQKEQERLSSLPSKRLRNVFASCGGTKRRRAVDGGDGGEVQKASNADGRCVTRTEVLGGYRPTSVSLPTDGDSARDDNPEHRIHVVTITRRRDHTVPLRGRGNRFRYAFDVCEEALDRAPIDTTKKVYRCMELGGWPVRCEECLWNEGGDSSPANPEQLEEERKLKELLAEHLAAAVRHLPPAARSSLIKDTPIYINRSQKFGPKAAPIEGTDMCFHPDKSWLIENGMSPKKEGCVEIYRVGNYSRDCQFWGPGGVLLHELSHAYHHKCLDGGYDNTDVKECYDNAMKMGLYDKVKVHNLKGTDM